MRDISKIIVHCSATRPAWMADVSTSAKVDEIRRWHTVDRGWGDIGYNYVIDRDGTVMIGRDLDKDGDTFDDIGAHTGGHNARSLGICLIGGFGSAANDAFEDHFTEAQNLALRKLISDIEERLGNVAVTGHNDYAAKACPGFKVDRWLHGEPPRRISLSQSKMIQAGAGVKAMSAASPIFAAVAGMPWQTVAILAGLAITAIAFSGVIDFERFRKARQGDL
ncbi:MAG: N-acetylmuramoyl-L-alanine amidase [Pseudomonadota bacterium]